MENYTFVLLNKLSEMLIVNMHFVSTNKLVIWWDSSQQATITEVFKGMNATNKKVFDHLGIFYTGWDYKHVGKVAEVLKYLEDNGFTVNPCKCKWAVRENRWLGY
jgi:hypothetical protein